MTLSHEMWELMIELYHQGWKISLLKWNTIFNHEANNNIENSTTQSSVSKFLPLLFRNDSFERLYKFINRKIENLYRLENSTVYGNFFVCV